MTSSPTVAIAGGGLAGRARQHQAGATQHERGRRGPLDSDLDDPGNAVLHDGDRIAGRVHPAASGGP